MYGMYRRTRTTWDLRCERHPGWCRHSRRAADGRRAVRMTHSRTACRSARRLDPQRRRPCPRAPPLERSAPATRMTAAPPRDPAAHSSESMLCEQRRPWTYSHWDVASQSGSVVYSCSPGGLRPSPPQPAATVLRSPESSLAWAPSLRWMGMPPARLRRPPPSRRTRGG
jgi:hypothetical protein